MIASEKFRVNAEIVIQSLRADPKEVEHATYVGLQDPFSPDGKQLNLSRTQDFIMGVVADLPRQAARGSLEEPLPEDHFAAPVKHTLAERLHTLRNICNSIGIEVPVSIEQQLDLCMLSSTTDTLAFAQQALEESRRIDGVGFDLEAAVEHLGDGQFTFRSVVEGISPNAIYPALDRKVIKDPDFIYRSSEFLKTSVQPEQQGVYVLNNVLDRLTQGDTGNYEHDWFTIGNWFAIADNLGINIPTQTEVLLLGMCFTRKAEAELWKQNWMNQAFERDPMNSASLATALRKTHRSMNRFNQFLSARIPFLIGIENLPEDLSLQRPTLAK